MKKIALFLVLFILFTLIGCNHNINYNKNPNSENKENEESFLDDYQSIYLCDFSKDFCDFEIYVYDCVDGTCTKTTLSDDSLEVTSQGFKGLKHSGSITKVFDDLEDKRIRITLTDIGSFPNYHVRIFKSYFDVTGASGYHATNILCSSPESCVLESSYHSRIGTEKGNIEQLTGTTTITFDTYDSKYYVNDKEIFRSRDVLSGMLYLEKDLSISIPFSPENDGNQPYKIKSIEIFQKSK